MSNIGKDLARLTGQMVRENAGVTAIEYGLVAALIAVACIVAFQATGTSLGDLYANWTSAVIAALQV